MGLGRVARGLDYLETDRTVEAKRVGIEGVSRYGKAALVTMAFDFAGDSITRRWGATDYPEFLAHWPSSQPSRPSHSGHDPDEPNDQATTQRLSPVVLHFRPSQDHNLAEV